MKRIKYPPRGSAGFAKLVSDYKNLFASNLPKMETDWKGWKIVIMLRLLAKPLRIY